MNTNPPGPFLRPYLATHMTKVSSSSSYLPIICQHPTVGKSTPTNMEERAAATALVAEETLKGGAGASKRLPVTISLVAVRYEHRNPAATKIAFQ